MPEPLVRMLPYVNPHKEKEKERKRDSAQAISAASVHTQTHTHTDSHRPGHRTSLAANMLAPHLVALDDHHAAAPPLLVPPLAAPAAVPAPVQRLERTPWQRALGQQRRQRRRGGVALEARRHGVRDRLPGQVAAGFTLLLLLVGGGGGRQRGTRLAAAVLLGLLLLLLLPVFALAAVAAVLLPAAALVVVGVAAFVGGGGGGGGGGALSVAFVASRRGPWRGRAVWGGGCVGAVHDVGAYVLAGQLVGDLVTHGCLCRSGETPAASRLLVE